RSSDLINLTFRKMRNSPPLGIVEFHARGWPTAREMQNSTHSRAPPLGKCRSHAREPSTARESQNSTRGNGPPLRKCRIPRAGTVHRSENAESHAQEWSTAREMQNSTRSRDPLLGKCGSHAREPATAGE